MLGVCDVGILAHLPDGKDPSPFILSGKVERRNMNPGQRAMARALDLADAGQRQNGRWVRKTVSDRNLLDGETAAGYRLLMAKAGVVIDGARKWPQGHWRPAPKGLGWRGRARNWGT